MKRPRDMSPDELGALRVVARTDPEIQRATWFEDDDPMTFRTPDGAAWRLHQTFEGEWVRVRAIAFG